MTETALALVAPIEKALTEAQTLEQYKDIRDMASTAKAYAKARGMGVEAENAAAEYILRAERGMGRALITMAANGTLLTQSDSAMRAGKPGPIRAVGRERLQSKLTLADLGLRSPEATYFRRLATQWDDKTFEERLAYVKGLGARLAKVDFYRGPKKDAERDAAVIREAVDEDKPTPAVTTFVRSAKTLVAMMDQLPSAELAEIAAAVRSVVEKYVTVRNLRS